MNQAFVTWVGKGGSLTATGSISGRATAALFRHRPRFRDNVLTMARRSLAHNFQAVWYRAAIMALCWPATPSEVKFAADSLLEGRVHCELVSEIRCRFPRSFRFCHPKKAVQADPVARPSEPSTRPCPRWGRTHHISPLEGGVRCELVSGGRADSAH
jgi:hypothetical protein